MTGVYRVTKRKQSAVAGIRTFDVNDGRRYRLVRYKPMFKYADSSGFSLTVRVLPDTTTLGAVPATTGESELDWRHRCHEKTQAINVTTPHEELMTRHAEMVWLGLEHLLRTRNFPSSNRSHGAAMFQAENQSQAHVLYSTPLCNPRPSDPPTLRPSDPAARLIARAAFTP